MTEVNQIDNITVDGVDFVVADLPDGIQKAIAKYNRFQVTAQQKQDDLELAAGGLRDLGAQIVGAVREVQAADAAAAAEAAAAEAAPVIEEDVVAETPVEAEVVEETPVEAEVVEEPALIDPDTE